MSLFTINRYQGEEESKAGLYAQDILAKIHQKAQLRKQILLTTSATPSHKNTNAEQQNTQPSSGGDDDDDDADDYPPRKKAKKTPNKSPKKKAVKTTPKRVKKQAEKDSGGEEPNKSPNKKKAVETTPKRVKKTVKDSEGEEPNKSPNKKKAVETTPKWAKEKTTKDSRGEEPSKSPNKKKSVETTPKRVKKRAAKDSGEEENHVEMTEGKVEQTGAKEVKSDADLEETDTVDEAKPEDDIEANGSEDDVTDDKLEDAEEDTSGYQQNKTVGGYTVIGDVRKRKIEKVHRVLPDWLANPAIVQNNMADTGTGLDNIQGLDKDLLSKLRDNGISHLFPVQRLVIPELLGGHLTGHLIGPAGYRPSDICCSAPTGSGKTLAFVLPIIQALSRRVVRRVRALVVLPVRDLAAQVAKVFATYSKGTNLTVALLVGQKSFTSEQQNLIRKGPRGAHVQADIVVATPGRLVDHIKETEGFDLHHLRYLVIDEADRMMEDMKQDWLAQVEQAVYGGDSPRPRPQSLSAATASKLEMPLQKLLFSATLSQNPEKLRQLNLFHPKLFTAVVEAPHHTTTSAGPVTDKAQDPDPSVVGERKGDFVGKFTTPAGLSEYLVMAREVGEKPLLVLYFLHQRKFRHMLVFTNSVEATHRLYLLIKLVGGLDVAEFSSNLHAVQRNKILKKFASGKLDVLICSDAMARGMDIENVQCVLSYDHAPYVKTYIHRIGRTARAGKVGTAFTLLEKKEVFNFKKMVREAGKAKVCELKISKGDLRGLLPDYQRALKLLPDILQSEKNR